MVAPSEVRPPRQGSSVLCVFDGHSPSWRGDSDQRERFPELTLQGLEGAWCKSACSPGSTLLTLVHPAHPGPPDRAQLAAYAVQVSQALAPRPFKCLRGACHCLPVQNEDVLLCLDSRELQAPSTVGVPEYILFFPFHR